MKTNFTFKNLLAIALSILLFSQISYTQSNTFPSTGSAGIGTTTPDASSLLEIKSTTKGLLIPRMTQAQRNAIASPATGLMIYQTNATPGFYYYGGNGWKSVAAKAWNLTGNAGTDSSINFIGTTDAHPLVFRVNNVRAGFIGYGKSNTSFGYNALTANTTGNYNTANGTGSLIANTGGYNNTASGSYALSTNTGGSFNVAAGSDALHNNTTGSSNTANGLAALYSNTTGYSNIAIGDHALYSNTTDHNLVAVGDSALYNAHTGFNTNGSIGIGSKALYSNTMGYSNTATGYETLFLDTTGSYNTANGYHALYSNTTGSLNTANGYQALYSNTIAYYNTANGVSALGGNTTGYYNTANGADALGSNITGNSNTAVGIFADVNSGAYINSTVLGVYALITASNQVRIGSVGGGFGSDPTSIGGKVGWSTLSDGRVKKNIKENVPGLVFINKLKPITYNIDNDAINKIVQRPVIKDKDGKEIKPVTDGSAASKADEQIVRTGFIAQDVEKAAKSLNYDFSGVDAAKNDKDLYGLRYAEFVVPLVKAVQELSKMNDAKDASIDTLKLMLAAQQNEINELKAMIVSNQSTVNSQQSTVISSASIQQNIPNPFTHTTNIGYTLPQKFSSAQIIITDKSGKTLKAINVSGSGKGNLNVDASTLSSGAYQYSLIVDGRLIDTKQMVLAK